MNVISSAVVAEINCIVTLCQPFWISDGYSLPGLATIHRSIIVTSITRTWRSPHRERCSDDVVGIFWIDGNSNFRRTDCVGVADSDDLLRDDRWRQGADDDNCKEYVE